MAIRNTAYIQAERIVIGLGGKDEYRTGSGLAFDKQAILEDDLDPNVGYVLTYPSVNEYSDEFMNSLSCEIHGHPDGEIRPDDMLVQRGEPQLIVRLKSFRD